MKNHDRIFSRKKTYSNNRYKTDNNFCLICRTRSRICQALGGKIELFSTKQILGMDIDLYKKWIENQKNPETNWTKIEIQHVKPDCVFDISKDEQLKEALFLKNTQPLLKEINKKKGIKYIFLYYRLQFIKVYHFYKVNEDGFYQKF